MKIAYVYANFWPYIRRGAERFTHELASYMTRQGHLAEVITTKPGQARIGRYGAVRVIYLPRLRHPLTTAFADGYLFHYLFGLTALPVLLANRYDIVHCWFYTAAPAAFLTARRNGGRYIYHDMMPQWYSPYVIDQLLFRWSIRRATAVAVLSYAAARELSRDYGIQASVIPPVVNLNEFKPAAKKNLAQPRILFTSSMGDPRKGLNMLIWAFKEIHNQYPEAVLQLAGPTEWFGLRDDTRALLDSPEIRSSVELIGAGTVASLPKLYSEAAVTVLPSLYEPFGMVLVESLAAGTPVVGTTPGGATEIITPGIGTLVKLNNRDEMSSDTKAGELATAILRSIELGKDPVTAHRCRERARRWDVETIGARTEALYREVLA